jgi:hypothetical protein
MAVWLKTLFSFCPKEVGKRNGFVWPHFRLAAFPHIGKLVSPHSRRKLRFFVGVLHDYLVGNSGSGDNFLNAFHDGAVWLNAVWLMVLDNLFGFFIKLFRLVYRQLPCLAAVFVSGNKKFCGGDIGRCENPPLLPGASGSVFAPGIFSSTILAVVR